MWAKRLQRAIGLALVLAVSQAASGQEVVTKQATPLKEGERVADEDKSFRVYTVERIDGDRLRLVAGKVAGWVPVRAVVLFDRAIDYFTKAIQDNPDAAPAYNRRGSIWNEKKEYDRAIADHTEAIRLDPNLARSYYHRANSWYWKHEFDKAIADYTEAVRLDPNDAWAYYNRADSWYWKSDYDKAIADYTEAIRLEPNDAETYAARGTTWRQKQDYDKAIKANDLFEDDDERQNGRERLELYRERKPYREEPE